MIRNLIAVLAGLSLGLGSLLIATAVHDHNMSEDVTAVWVCSLQGNYECGPNSKPIYINPSNLLYGWEYVPSNWLE